MTIRRGEDWGEVVAAPADLVDVDDDADAADVVAAGDGRAGACARRRPVRDARAHRRPSRPCGGCRSTCCESRPTVGRSSAIAHVVARRSWWRGGVLAVMNGDHLGRWDAAPRAHPADGRADVVEVDAAMGPRARWQAWRRLPTGAHVPHPGIRTRRVADESWQFGRPRRLWVDGVQRGTVRSLRVTVEPDGATVHA